MKKLLLFVSVLTLGLTSCSSDDDSSSSDSIEGTWEWSKEGTIVNGEEFLYDYDHFCDNKKDYVQILSGGVIKEVWYETDCTEDVWQANWSRNGNTLTVTDGTDSVSGEILELTNTTLKLKYTETFDGTTYINVDVYTRR